MYIPQRTYGAVRQESVDDHDEAFPCVSISIFKKVTTEEEKKTGSKQTDRFLSTILLYSYEKRLFHSASSRLNANPPYLSVSLTVVRRAYVENKRT